MLNVHIYDLKFSSYDKYTVHVCAKMAYRKETTTRVWRRSSPFVHVSLHSALTQKIDIFDSRAVI